MHLLSPEGLSGAEIVKVSSYMAKIGQRTRNEILRACRKGELRKLYRVRFGQALSSKTIDKTIAETFGDVSLMGATELGKQLELTLKERVLCGIRTIRCFDKTESETQKFYRCRKKEQNRLAKRRQRARKKINQKGSDNLDSRPEDLFMRLSSDFVTTAELLPQIVDAKPWRGPNEKRLSQSSLCRAVNRAILELEQKHLIEVWRGFGSRGQRLYRIRKRINLSAVLTNLSLRHHDTATK